MPEDSHQALVFYPAYCFSLSTTYNTWARLTVADVHDLQERPGFEGQNLYFYLNHPIKWIRLVGVVVAIDIYPSRWIFVLDDSSGATLEITCGRPSPARNDAKPTLPADGSGALSKSNAPTEGVTATGREINLGLVDVGTVVKLKGGIGSFRGTRQLLLERLSVLRTTKEELVAWDENTHFRSAILSIPWSVKSKDEERARKRAEGLERRDQARNRQKRRGVDSVRMHANSNHGKKQYGVTRKKNDHDAQDHPSAAEKAKMEERKAKKAEERAFRKEAFERLRKRENGNTSTADPQKTLDKVPNEEWPNSHGSMRVSAHLGREERAKIQRAKERQSRELLYQSLKRSSD